MPETYSFWDLHVAIQDAMGWLDYHLHVFRVDEPGAMRALQVGIPDDDPFEGDEPIVSGWEVPITTYFGHPGAVVQYDYDLGDGWEHDVILEVVVPGEKGKRYPRCIGGARACPPEDVGGAGGYEELLAVIRDPNHKEHQRMLQWLGGRFSPEKFDANKVKFDDPDKRWDLAFGQPSSPSRPRRRRTTALANSRRQRTRPRRARRWGEH